jgi:hypothetical protein
MNDAHTRSRSLQIGCHQEEGRRDDQATRRNKPLLWLNKRAGRFVPGAVCDFTGDLLWT